MALEMTGAAGLDCGRRVRRALAVVLLCACLPLVCVAQPAGGPQKVVAVVYDDSGSMTSGQRWVRANYALKVLAASLKEDDVLLVVRMSSPSKVEEYARLAGIKDAIAVLQRQSGATGNTPYQSVRTAIDALLKRSEEEKWLIVISDGGFNDFDVATSSQDIDRALGAGIRSAFVLIEQDSNRAAEDWKAKGNATIFDARTGSSIVSELEAAAALLNGQSRGGIKATASGKELSIDTAFPLRRMTVLRQDTATAELHDVTIGGEAMAADEFRTHRFPPNSPSSSLGLPKEARLYHLKTRDGHVADAATNALRMRFDGDAASMRLKLLPEVAARFTVELVDLTERPMPREKNGVYTVCDKSYRIIARLTDDLGKSLAAGRTDIPMFSVAAMVNGISSPLAIDPQRAVFFRDFAAGKPGAEAAISGTAEYPGYFHRLSAPLQVRFLECRRNIVLKLESGVDGAGTWHSRIDDLDRAPWVRLAATIDGKSASVAELQTWRTDLGQDGAMFDLRYEQGAILLRPKAFCCLTWWKEVGPGLMDMPFKLITGGPYDTIVAPAGLKFDIAPPAATWDKIRWYVCPFALLLLIVFLAWYAFRLLRKSRFGPDSRFVAEEKLLDTEATRQRTTVLRELSNAVARWVWPSRAEVVELYGIRFRSAGEDLIADGRHLQQKHKIPGWVFDRLRLEADRERDRWQDDATISDKMVWRIVDEHIVTSITYHY